MKVGVPKETAQSERRVALIPDVVASLAGKGAEISSLVGYFNQHLFTAALV